MYGEEEKERIFRELDAKLRGVSRELLKDYLVSRGLAEDAGAEGGDGDGQEG